MIGATTETIRAVLFDVDGTLFDRAKAQELILQIIVAELQDVFAGLPSGRIAEAFEESDRLTVQEYEGGTLGEDFRARRSKLFLSLLDLGEAPADAITALYVHRYPTLAAPVAGAAEVVKALKGRYQLGVVSNGFADVQYKKLTAVGVGELFQCVVLSEELGVAKPDPAIFHHAAERLGRSPGQCLYVGDSYVEDGVGPKSAGMHACWFNPRGRPAGEVRPDMDIRSLDEILQILDAADG